MIARWFFLLVAVLLLVSIARPAHAEGTKRQPGAAASLSAGIVDDVHDGCTLVVPCSLVAIERVRRIGHPPAPPDIAGHPYAARVFRPPRSTVTSFESS